tara:strand:+ start:128457 stop:128897 length:441 start_codon:yes stop_codon:yes gene_type:complete
MGLDQYAYARDPRVELTEEEIEYGEGDIHIMDWRKHNRLQGYMEQVWLDQGGEYGECWSDGFNGKEVKLGKEEIDALEEAINNLELPQTSGFFFGSDSYTWDSEGTIPEEEAVQSDYYHKASDLEFVAEARRYLAEGFEVYYNSSW